MERAIRIQCFQTLVNYRKPSSFIIKETFPLPPYSTVIGMVHAACNFKEYHNMKVSIQGTNAGTISELYTRYSFNSGAKYKEDRHQICIKEGSRRYGIFKGIANVELVCDNHMVLHIMPEEEDFDFVYESMRKPPRYLSLGRYEDILDVEKVEIVNLTLEEEAYTKHNIYIPVDRKEELALGNTVTTVYNLTKKYDKENGYRKWKPNTGRIRAFYYPAGATIGSVYVDDSKEEDLVVLV